LNWQLSEDVFVSFVRLIIDSGKVDAAMIMIRQRYAVNPAAAVTEVYGAKQLAIDLGLEKRLQRNDHAFELAKEQLMSPGHAGSIVKALFSSTRADQIGEFMIIARDLLLSVAEDSGLDAGEAIGRGNQTAAAFSSHQNHAMMHDLL
jgi:hypothetical protein